MLDDSQGRRNDQDIAVSSESPNYAEMLGSLFEVAYNAAMPSKEKIATVKESLASGDKIKSLTEVLRVTLPEDGWSVEAPGILLGKSNATYAFPIVAKKGKRTMAVDIVISKKEQDSKDRTVQSVMRKLDMEGVEVVVASSPPSGEEVKKLAELMGVSLITAHDTIGAVADLRKLLRTKS